MKKVLFGMVAIALAMSAQATLLSAIRTKAPGAPDLGEETVNAYTCYLLSGAKMATAMGIKSIGPTEVDRVSAWLSQNFAVNYQSFKDQKPYATVSVYYQGSMDFRYSAELSPDNRFGVVTYYDDEAEAITQFRVFNFNGTNNIYDFTTGSGVWADWNAAEPIPEPTSGLLLLLGVAGLALKRKRA